MEADSRTILYQDYTASMLGLLAQGVAQMNGANWTAPSFIEMVYPQVKDTRTAEDIKNHVLSLLN